MLIFGKGRVQRNYRGILCEHGISINNHVSVVSAKWCPTGAVFLAKFGGPAISCPSFQESRIFFSQETEANIKAMEYIGVMYHLIYELHSASCSVL